MSKTTSSSKSSQPQFSSTVYGLNGQNKASTQTIGNNVFTNYNMNEYEKSLYDYAQKTLSEIVPNVNVFSQQTMNDINSKLNAYQNQATRAMDALYTPQINSLKNDIASRFGNINNSMFLDKLAGIENSRSNAMAQLAENLLLKQNDLVNNELANRYNFINLLNDMQNQYNANAYNTISKLASMSKINNPSSEKTSGSSRDLLDTVKGIISIMGAL